MKRKIRKRGATQTINVFARKVVSAVKRGDITPSQGKQVLAKLSREIRKNPTSRGQVVIAGHHRGTDDVGYFDGTHLQPRRDKAVLYPSSRAASAASKAITRWPENVTVVVVPAHWSIQHLRERLGAARKNPASRGEISRAAKRLQQFTGHRVKHARRIKRHQTAVGYELGPVDGITYIATRDGETARYHHRFRKDSRPSLVASSDGRSLDIVGGRFQVTARGIVDK